MKASSDKSEEAFFMRNIIKAILEYFLPIGNCHSPIVERF